MNFLTKVIQRLIDINEKIIFYPKLRQFYTSMLGDKTFTVLDVGSNKGQSIQFFLKINTNATIYGFEPNGKLFNLLEKKYSNHQNISIKNIGISSKKGTLTFHENIMDETSTFETLNKDSEYLKKKARILGVSTDTIIVDSYDVNVSTLSTFLSEHDSIFVDVLKIDVEGHEYDCLKGLFVDTQQTYPVRYIQLESHHDDMYEQDSHHLIADLLKKNGFKEVKRIKHGFGDFYELIFENTQLV